MRAARQAARGAEYPLYTTLLLGLTYVLHAFDRSILAVVIQPIAQTLRLDDGQIGLLGGLAYGASYALCSIPLGLLVDRVSRRLFLAAVLGIWSTLTFVSGFASTFLLLILCRAIIGAAEAGGSPATISLMTDLHPPERRSRVLSILYVGSGIGGAASGIVGGYVTEHYGWQTAFMVAGLPGIILAALLATTLREPARGQHEGKHNIAAPPFRKALASIGRNRPLVLIYMALPGGAAATSIIGIWTVPFLVRMHGLSVGEAGLWFALILSGGVSLGALLSGFVADRLNRMSPAHTLRLLSLNLLLSIPVTIAAYTVSDALASALLLFLANVMLSCFITPALGLILTLAGPSMRGLATSLRDVLIFLIGFGVAPYLVGVLSSALGGGRALGTALCVAVATSAFWSAVIFLLVGRRVSSK